MNKIKPSEFDWANFLEELKEETTHDYKIKDELWLLATIVAMVPSDAYNDSFNYVQEELDKVTIDTFTKNKVDTDYTPLMDAHVFYHKMFRQVDVFYEYSYIGERYLPIDMLFYNFIHISNAHWYFFKKAVFKYVGERDGIDTDWL